jgi:hypothetical protein
MLELREIHGDDDGGEIYETCVHAKQQTKKFTSPSLHKKAIALICLCINYVKIIKYSVNVRDTLRLFPTVTQLMDETLRY